MSRTISLCRLLPVVILASMLTAPTNAQDPTNAPPPRRPGVSIGGPFGVIIGGGRGVRFGGPNGAQFGGGFGARFGGEYGAQFGGGEGVRIGPRDYDSPRRSEPDHSDAALQDPPGRFIDPTYDSPLPHEAVMHYPKSADEKVRVRINGREIELYPGDTIAIPSSGSGISMQVGRPIGGYGWRRSLGPGTYVFQQSGRGWSIAAGTIPREEQRPRLLPSDVDAPDQLNVEESEIEQLPTPTPDEPVGRDASGQDEPRRLLFRRRR